MREYSCVVYFSAVDVDAAVCAAEEKDQLADLVDLVYRLRHTENTADTLPSTEYALLRTILKHDATDLLFKIIADPVRYFARLHFERAATAAIARCFFPYMALIGRQKCIRRVLRCFTFLRHIIGVIKAGKQILLTVDAEYCNMSGFSTVIYQPFWKRWRIHIFIIYVPRFL